MGEVYRIHPDPGCASLGHFLEKLHLEPGVDGRLAALTVLHVDVDPGDNSWEIRIAADSPGAGLLQQLAPLETRLVEAIPGLARVRFVADRPVGGEVPSGRSPEPAAGADEVAASAEAPAPAAGTGDPPAYEDDLDAYMEMIARRAREWVELQESSDRGGDERKRGPGDVLLGRRITDGPVPIATLKEEERQVVIEGEVIHVDVREMRSGRKLVTFDVTDRTDSISVKHFEEDDGLSGALKVGDWVRVRGAAQFDKFSGELMILPRDCMRVAKPAGRVDRAEVTRVELHLHTKMSALDGAVDIEPLIKLAAEWRHPAVAITDHGVVQAFPEAYQAAKAAGIKLIYGLEGYLADSADRNSRTYHIILLARNRTGLTNLYKLVSISHLHYFYRRPRIPREVLQAHREGLWVGSACEAGELYQAILSGRSEEELLKIADFYDYLEIQPLANNRFLLDEGRVKDEEELREINRRIVSLGERLGKPVVATGDVHFLLPEDEVFRQIIMASHGFETERPTPLYLRTTEEMLEEFSYLGEEKAREVVIDAPRAIADSVEAMRPVPEGFHPPYLEGAEEEIRRMATERAKAIYGPDLPAIVKERLEKELGSIIGNGYASLYLIAHKLVKRSLDDGYLVGSRGSVGSSLVATLCGITEVNPLPPHYICPECHYFEVFDDGSVGVGADLPKKRCPTCGTPLRRDGYDIPFETFLGFHGDKVPDIDLNFSGEYQPIAHKYAEELFGKERVYRAGTIGRLADRTAYGYVRNYLESRGIQVRSAEMNRLVRGCTGVRKTTGQHPGGLMIIPEGREVYEFTPIQHPANDAESGVITTHFDCDTIHDHLVKLDILGHDDPTVLRMLQDLTGIDVRTVPIDDPETLKLFSGLESLGISKEDASGEVGTLAIPEFGTRFVRQMLVETRPSTVGELVRISGLSHGTNVWTGNAQELIRASTCTLKEVIACRDDIMTYLIRKGLPPGDAFNIMERVRKGKGLSAENEKLMEEHGVPKWYIESCKKISYLFPKAHAAAYVMMALRIAYFKVHHPLAFYSAYFTVRADDFDAGLIVRGPGPCRKEIERVDAKGNEASAKEKGLVTVLEVALEAMARGVRFLPVDLYKSDVSAFRIEDGALRCPLASLQGVGTAAAQAIAAARERPFTSVEDLQRRAKVSRAVVDVMREHGALADLPETDQITLF